MLPAGSLRILTPSRGRRGGEEDPEEQGALNLVNTAVSWLGLVGVYT